MSGSWLRNTHSFLPLQHWVESFVYLSDVGSLWDLEVGFRVNDERMGVRFPPDQGWVGYVKQQQNGGGPPELHKHILHQPPTPWVLAHSLLSLRHFMLEFLLKAFTVPAQRKWPLLGEEMTEWVRDIHTENSISRRHWGLLRKRGSPKESKDVVGPLS